jgi:DNA-binding ferritin-like protein (Dps family)
VRRPKNDFFCFHGEVTYRLDKMLSYIDPEVVDFAEKNAATGQELNQVIGEAVAKARARKTINENSKEAAQQPAATAQA